MTSETILTERERETLRFNQAVLDALPTQIAVLDRQGIILAVNREWNDFALRNQGMLSRLGVGVNYLEVCRQAQGPFAQEAPAAAVGIQAVLDGVSSHFNLEYTCHSPREQRLVLAAGCSARPRQRPGRGGPRQHHRPQESGAGRREAGSHCRDRGGRHHRHAPDGPITSWNRGAERLYGYTAEEILGRPLALLFPEDRAEAARILSRIRQGERIPAFETVRRRKDGKGVEVMVSVSPVLDVQGRATGAAAIAHDVTERQTARGAVSPGPEDGGRRPAGGRRGPRLQQPAHRHQRLQRAAARRRCTAGDPSRERSRARSARPASGAAA